MNENDSLAFLRSSPLVGQNMLDVRVKSKLGHVYFVKNGQQISDTANMLCP